MALKPVTLDIVIMKICPRTIYYTLAANGQAEEWRIPDGSTFNTSQLIVGQRYRVVSGTVMVPIWDHKRYKYVKKERFDWISATEIGQKVKLQARSAKKREASEALAALPLADSGALFTW